jgi:hypothetical protein
VVLERGGGEEVGGGGVEGGVADCEIEAGGLLVLFVNRGGKGNGYVSRPREARGMSSPEGVVFRSLMRGERALAMILSWAYLRPRSSMSARISASVMEIVRGVRTGSNESPFWPLGTS